METRLHVGTDDFIRTTQARHMAGAQALWRRLRDSDQIYLGHYEGWYAVRDEDFHAAEDITLLADGTRVAPTGAPRGMGARAEFPVPAEPVAGEAAGALRGESRLRRPP